MPEFAVSQTTKQPWVKAQVRYAPFSPGEVFRPSQRERNSALGGIEFWVELRQPVLRLRDGFWISFRVCEQRLVAAYQ